MVAEDASLWKEPIEQTERQMLANSGTEVGQAAGLTAPIGMGWYVAATRTNDNPKIRVPCSQCDLDDLKSWQTLRFPQPSLKSSRLKIL
jgi:hypothetical protein